MEDKIYFDSQDWNSIVDTFNKVNGKGCRQFGKTEDGNEITFDVGKDNSLITKVYQKNGWVREKRYYIDDKCIEGPFYSKEDI